jgi:hypothetical protein
MFNIYYILISILTIIATYMLQNQIKNKDKDIVIAPNLKSKVSSLKKKFNIKSSETSIKNLNKKKIEEIKKVREKFIYKKNIDIISLPTNSSTSLPICKSIPEKFINGTKSKFNSKKINNIDNFNKIFYPVIKSFINCKLIYNKIFESNNQPIINSVDNFVHVYKNIVSNSKKYNGYNILIKLSNNTDISDDSSSSINNINKDNYIIMKKNTLIKIKNNITHKNIDNILSKDKIFLIKENNNYYVTFGNKLESDINNNQIKNIFFNKTNMNDQKIIKNYEFFCKFKKISFIYWIAIPINFE